MATDAAVSSIPTHVLGRIRAQLAQVDAALDSLSDHELDVLDRVDGYGQAVDWFVSTAEAIDAELRARESQRRAVPLRWDSALLCAA